MLQIQYVMDMANANVENANVVSFRALARSILENSVNAMITAAVMFMELFVVVCIIHV